MRWEKIRTEVESPIYLAAKGIYDSARCAD